MAIEIEVKAWAGDPEELRSRISGFASYEGEFSKEDTYWFPQAPAGSGLPVSGVRLRKERFTGKDGEARLTCMATYKTKEVREGIEVNDEREFEVSSADSFQGLLSLLGLEQRAGKSKRGWLWRAEGAGIELSLVEGLGWFVEMEILAKEDNPETVAAARARLLDLLHKTGIPEDKIESRYYTEMLKG